MSGARRHGVSLRRGAGLVELVVVVLIVAVLLALSTSLIPVALRFAHNIESQANAARARTIRSLPHRSATVRSRALGGQYIVILRDGSDPHQELQRLAALHAVDVMQVYVHAFKGFAARMSPATVSTLLTDPAVRYVEQDQTLVLASASRDETPRNLRRINAAPLTPSPSPREGEGTGVRGKQGETDADIAIIDTGVDLSNDELNVVFRMGFGASADAKDIDGHGTQVASVIASYPVGVAPGARLWALKVADGTDSGAASNLIAALDFVISKADEIEVANVGVLTNASMAVNLAAAGCVRAGVTVVAAAGNDRRDVRHVSPASEPGVLTVAALTDTDGRLGGYGTPTLTGDADDTLASFSNFGPLVDFLAPGVGVDTIDLAGSAGKGTGTSFAAAHVTGLAARLHHNSKVLRSTSTPPPTPGAIQQQLETLVSERIPGRGRLNPYPVANARSHNTNSSPTYVAPTRSRYVPLSYEANLGQTDAQVKYLCRTKDYTAFLTHEGLLVAAKSLPAQRIHFANANTNPVISGSTRLPGIANYFRGKDPSRWLINIPTYSEVRYRDVYPGIDVLCHSEEGRLRYDMIVAPGADPSWITLSFPDAAAVNVDGAGLLRLALPGSDAVVSQSAPVIFQLGLYGREAVRGRYVAVGPKQVRFEVGDYDRRRALVIDPIVFSTYLGGSGRDQALNVAFDSSNNIYIAGMSNASDFPTTSGSVQPAFGGTEDITISKFDPAGATLLFSTYLGGNSFDDNSFGIGLAVDAATNVYVCGSTQSSNFPTTVGAFQTVIRGRDSFITKLNPSGNALLYSTLLGGTGTSSDNATSLAIDATGAAFVCGFTSSADFPTTPGAFQTTFGGASNDAFVVKLNPAGSALMYSTLLGGSGQEFARSIAVNSAGNAFVTGRTQSTDWPVSAGAIQSTSAGNDDVFVVQLNATGTGLVYSTLLGSTGSDEGMGIAVDAADNAYVTGWGGSPFPVTAGVVQPVPGGAGDAFVSKVNPTGTALLFSTYLGGSGSDQGLNITLDATGRIYVVGSTGSTNFAVQNATQATFGGGTSDAFVTVLDPAASNILFSTYLGGAGADRALDVAVDNTGAILVTGRTSGSFTTVTPFQGVYGGGSDDTFVTKITATLTLPAAVIVSQSGGTTAVAEGGSTDTYTVALNTAPTANVTITLNPGTQVTVAPTTLTFTPANWNTPQTVTVTAVDDTAVEGAHTGTISHTSASTDANYNAITIANVVANITDNDSAGGTIYGVNIFQNPNQLFTIDTATGAGTPVGSHSASAIHIGVGFRGAKLYAFDSGNLPNMLNELSPTTGAIIAKIDLGITGMGEGDITFRSDGMGFLANANANDLYRFDVTVPSATLIGNMGGLRFDGLAFDGAGVLYGIEQGGKQLYTINTATAAPTLVGPTGITASYAVGGLTFDSTGNLYAGFANGGGPADFYKLDPKTGTATLIGKIGINGLTGLTFSPGAASSGVTITESGGSTDIAEGGATDTYTLALSTAPTANVTITINPGTQVTVAPTTLTFTPANWNTPQTVTVTAVDDTAVEGTHTGTISHTAASTDTSYNAISIASVTVNITDNDSGLQSTLYGITGSGLPTNLITIDVGTGAGTLIAAVAPGFSPNGLDFRGNQLYTFEAGPRTLREIDRVTAAAISSIPTGVPPPWSNLGTLAFRSDGIGFINGGATGSQLYSFDITTATSALVTGTATVGLNLAFNSADVLYAVTGGNLQTVNQTTGALTLVGPTGISGQAVTCLAFDASNNLYAAAIIQSAPFPSFLYRINVATGAATLIGPIGFNAVDGIAFSPGPIVGATITESAGSTAVTEAGATDTYTVVLTSAPTANVTITLNPGTQVTVAPTTLTFTPANWNTPQTVTVTAVDDTAVEGAHTGTISHTAASTDTNYNGVTIASVTVNITDNDAAAVAPGTLYGIVFNNQLITINTSTGAGAAVAPVVPGISPIGIGFRSGKLYSFDQLANRILEISPTTGTTLNTIDIGAVALEGDLAFRSDGIGFLTSPGSLIRFDITGPSSAVIGPITSTDGLAYHPSGQLYGLAASGATLYTINESTGGSTLIGNTGIPAGATVGGLAFDAAGKLYAAVGSGSGSSLYQVDPATAAATLIGNIGFNNVSGIAIVPGPSIVIAQAGGTAVTEGGATDTYTLVLDTAPTANVTITLNPGTQVTVAPTTLTFTPANWNAPQTVTVTAVDDTAVEGAHTGTISHTSASTDANYNAITIASVTVNITDNDSGGGGGGTLYGVTWGNQLIRIDTGTGAGTLVGALSSNMNPAGLAFRAGKLYVWDNVAIKLREIDPATGATLNTIDVGAIPFSEGDIAFRGDGTGFIAVGFPSTMRSFDIVAGTNTTLGPAGFTIDGLTFNSAGVLLGITQSSGTGADTSSRLYSVNQTTGALTLIGDTGLTGMGVGGLAFDSAGNFFAGLSRGGGGLPSELYRIDASTGAATLIGDIGFNGICGLAFSGPPSAGVTVTQTGGSTSVTEGGATDTYTVALNTAPTANVTITINPGTQVTAAPTTLTFTPANWNTPQTVTVTAVDDTAVEGGHTGTITHSASSTDTAYNALAIASVTANITDNDGAPGALYGVTANRQLIKIDVKTGVGTAVGTPFNMGGSIPVGMDFRSGKLLVFAEGSSNLYEIDPATGANVGAAIPVAGGGTLEGDVAFRSDGIGFVGWNSLFTFDPSIATPTLTQLTPGPGVNIDGLAFNANVLYALQETGNQLYTINQTTGARTPVGTGTGLPPGSGLGNGGLAFDNLGNLYGCATTGGASNLFSIDPATGVGAMIGPIGFAGVRGIRFGAAIAGVTITQSGGTTAIAEGGATDTYAVALNTPPTANVTITLNPGTQVTVAPATLTFTPANWDTPQTVTVTAVDDTAVEGAHTGTISHTATSTDTSYSGISIGSVTVSITDNDFGPGMGPIYAITDGGGNVSNIELLTIDPATGKGTLVGKVPTVGATFGLSFYRGRLYTYSNTTGMVHEIDKSTGAVLGTIDVGLPNMFGEGDLVFRKDGTAFISGWTSTLYNFTLAPSSTVSVGATGKHFDGLALNSAGALYGLTNLGHELYTINPATGASTFVGATGLLNLPDTSGGLVFDGGGNLYGTSARFPGNPSSLYKIDPATGNATLIGPIGFNGVCGLAIDLPASAGVTITQSGGSTAVAEGGATDTYTVVLDSAPTANVTITLNPGTQVTVAPATLTFTPANWSTPQTVTVTAVDDTAIEGAHTGTISHTAASSDAGYNGIAIASVTANITDNDVLAPGVNVTQSGGSTAVAEGGATDTYTVALNSQPTANVTVTINPGTQVSVAPATLTFTTANWNTPQTVTVTAVNDAAVEGPHTGTITHTAASGDTSYNAITIASVTANITDNDFPGVTITQSGGSTAVTEGGASDTYTVVLNSIPTANVTITVSPNAQVTAAPATLTFTPANWNTAQTVTVAAVNDKVYEGAHTGVVSHTAASTDAGYSGIAVASVTVAITDDDPVPPVDAGDTSDVATYMGVLSGSKTITGADTLRHKNGKFDDDWYAWRMGQTGTLTVTLGNLNVVASGPQAKSTFGDLQFRVYRVINGNLIQFASSQESGAKTLSIPVNAQERILVWVYGIYYTQATYDLSVDVK